MNTSEQPRKIKNEEHNEQTRKIKPAKKQITTVDSNPEKQNHKIGMKK